MERAARQDLRLTTWLPALFAVDFIALFAETIVNAANGTPSGWTFQDGVYEYGGTSAAIEIRVGTTVESGYGPAGTPVEDDIFSLDSYLEGAEVVADAETETVTITYDQPGPLVELLGLGPTPPNPLVLTADDQQAILDNLSTLALEPTYISYGVTPILDWSFEWVSSPETIASIAAGDLPIDIELVAVDATREDLGQTITTEEWNVKQTGGDVGGYTTFTVDGGHFAYRGRVDLTSEAFTIVLAERELECP